jgi:hypothetical protein
MKWNEAEYKKKEMKRSRKERECNRQSLSESRANRDELIQDIIDDPKLFKERVGFILAGHFGAGVRYDYEKLSHAMNRAAWLFRVTAAYEWSVPERHAIDAYKTLPEPVRTIVDADIAELIKQDDEEHAQ